MPTLFSLDVAFSSDIDPADPTLPVVMAYGYAVHHDGDSEFQGRGQTEENISGNDNFVFSVFDTSPNSCADMVTQIEIVFGEGLTPFWGANSTTPESSPIIFPASSGVASQNSYGCNTTGFSWQTPTYTVLTDIPNGTPFECTVTVTTKLLLSDGKTYKTYSVDPEVIVEGGD